jgi:hypothetical protein
MGVKLVKLKELEYNETLTIMLIQKDEQLKSVFADELNLSFEMLITLSKENKLSKETKELIKSIFDDVILTQTSLINRYEFLAKTDDIELTETLIESSEPIVKEINEVKVKKEKVLPRRYGKSEILKDIEKQGTRPTPLQTAMLRVNDLKNAYVTLSNRGISDMLGGTNLLSDEDCRDITSSIAILENKLKTILKRKNKK